MRRLLLAAAMLALPTVARADGADHPILLREYTLYGCALGPNWDWCTKVNARVFTNPVENNAGENANPWQFDVILTEFGCGYSSVNYVNLTLTACQTIHPVGVPVGLDLAYDPGWAVRLIGEDGCTNPAINQTFSCDISQSKNPELHLAWTPTGNPNGPTVIYRATYTTTPEPASVVLMASGLIGVFAARRRRQALA